MFECQTETQFKTEPGPVSKKETPRPHDPGSPDQRSTDGATQAVAVSLAASSATGPMYICPTFRN